MATRANILSYLQTAFGYAKSASRKHRSLDRTELDSAAGLGVAKGLDSYDPAKLKPTGSERSWVLSSAWWSVQDEIRRQYGRRKDFARTGKRPPANVEIDNEKNVNLFSNPAMSTHDAPDRSDEARLLWADLDSLPEREQAVIALTTVEENTLSEVGAMMGISESRVSQIRTKGLKTLRVKLEARGGDRDREDV